MELLTSPSNLQPFCPSMLLIPSKNTFVTIYQMELLSSPSNLQPFCPSMSLTPSINTTSLASEGTPCSRQCSWWRVSFDVVEEELQHPHGNVPNENAKRKQRQNQGLRGQRKQQLLSRQAIRRTSREFCCAKTVCKA